MGGPQYRPQYGILILSRKTPKDTPNLGKIHIRLENQDISSSQVPSLACVCGFDLLVLCREKGNILELFNVFFNNCFVVAFSVQLRNTQ